MKPAVIILAIMLAGCSGRLASLLPKSVPVAVPVACVQQLPVKPDFPDTDEALLASSNAMDRLKRLIAGRPLHFVYEAQLLAALQGCLDE